MTRLERLHLWGDRAVGDQVAAEELRRTGRFQYLADDEDCPDVMRLAALTEELGEVARCLHDGDRVGLPRELSQLAGIAIAWASVA